MQNEHGSGTPLDTASGSGENAASWDGLYGLIRDCLDVQSEEVLRGLFHGLYLSSSRVDYALARTQLLRLIANRLDAVIVVGSEALLFQRFAGSPHVDSSAAGTLTRMAEEAVHQCHIAQRWTCG